MEYVKLFLWFWAGYYVGILAASYCLVQSLIVLRVGIPMTLTGIREGFISSRVPLVQYTASLIILPVVFTAVTFCVEYFGSGIFVIGYYMAVAIGLLMGLPKSGKNPTNLNEYMTSNAPFMDKSKLAEAIDAPPVDER